MKKPERDSLSAGVATPEIGNLSEMFGLTLIVNPNHHLNPLRRLPTL
jgi:hypothetical protein